MLSEAPLGQSAVIGFGNMAEPDFCVLTFWQRCREVSARRRHGGLGFTPASAFVIQTLCLHCAAYGGRGYVVLGALIYATEFL